MSETTETEATPQAEPRLLKRYRDEVVPELQKQLGRQNVLSLPRLMKIALNMGVGRGKDDKKILEEAQGILSDVSGQRPVMTQARVSVAAFQLREGQTIGCRVTIRGRRMYEFLDRLIGTVLPRIRDFQGVSKDSCDGHGNYSLGIREHIVFPEIDPDAYTGVYGMDITLCTSARTDPEAIALLTLLGMPFRQ